MPRLPYVSPDLSEPADVVGAMRLRRGGSLNEADRLVLHSPAFARGFNVLMGAVRQSLGVPAYLRELAICGVGYLNRSEFEVVNHIPILRSSGATEAQIAALSDFVEAAENRTLFDDVERLVMRLTIEMTRDVEVSDATFSELVAVFPNSQEVVELVGTIAAYNMASRFLVALKL
jgi:alkylhydroperoxidase family enzyme